MFFNKYLLFVNYFVVFLKRFKNAYFEFVFHKHLTFKSMLNVLCFQNTQSLYYFANIYCQMPANNA